MNKQEENSAHVMEDISSMSSDINKMKEKCENLRKLMDEGTYKLDALLNVINNLKKRESSMAASINDEAAMKQLSEEQVDSMLDMLKTPAFQSVARKLLVKWTSADNNEFNSSQPNK